MPAVVPGRGVTPLRYEPASTPPSRWHSPFPLGGDGGRAQAAVDVVGGRLGDLVKAC